MRVRITIRNDNPRLELRGFYDVSNLEDLEGFAAHMRGFGVVVASPADDDYDPFAMAEPEDPPSAAVRGEGER